PAQRRHRRPGRGRCGRGHGRAGAGRGGGGEVRRRLGGRDAPQRGGLPEVAGDLVTNEARSAVVVLIGPPGAAKSSVGALLATQLGVPFSDTDDLVAAAAGKPVGDIFVEDGEAVFREFERTAVARGLEGFGTGGGVLAVGSGAVLDTDVRRLIEPSPV